MEGTFKSAAEYYQKAEEAKANSKKAPITNFKDPEFEKEVKQMFETTFPHIKVSRISPFGMDWGIVKNGLGKIDYKCRNFIVVYHNQKKNACFYTETLIRSDYIIGNKYGKPYIQNSWDTYSTKINCEK